MKQLPIPLTWEPLFKDADPELCHISKMLDTEKKLGVYYPQAKLYNAFHLTPSNQVKVIIIGTEPYNIPHKDQGLAFSVEEEDEIPKTIRAIYNELFNTVKGFKIPNHGCLESWAKQGVLLLNQTLTVSVQRSHLEYELWYGFLNKMFKFINTINPDTIVVLWGQTALNINELIPDSFIKLEAGYPSNFIDTFSKCDHFNKINDILKKKGKSEICWQIDDTDK